MRQHKRVKALEDQGDALTPAVREWLGLSCTTPAKPTYDAIPAKVDHDFNMMDLFRDCARKADAMVAQKASE